VMLGMEPKASHMLDKHFTTEQHPQPAHKFFLFFLNLICREHFSMLVV
jgi:hypothetical protein